MTRDDFSMILGDIFSRFLDQKFVSVFIMFEVVLSFLKRCRLGRGRRGARAGDSESGYMVFNYMFISVAGLEGSTV